MEEPAGLELRTTVGHLHLGAPSVEVGDTSHAGREPGLGREACCRLTKSGSSPRTRNQPDLPQPCRKATAGLLGLTSWDLDAVCPHRLPGTPQPHPEVDIYFLSVCMSVNMVSGLFLLLYYSSVRKFFSFSLWSSSPVSRSLQDPPCPPAFLLISSSFVSLFPS